MFVLSHPRASPIFFTMSQQDIVRRMKDYGVKQVRKIVELDQLLDSLLAQAVPFVYKKSYLRLLFNGYIQELGEVHMLDVNFPKFLSFMRHIVLYDIEHYYMYFAGLTIPKVEDDERDEVVEQSKIVSCETDSESSMTFR